MTRLPGAINTAGIDVEQPGARHDDHPESFRTLRARRGRLLFPATAPAADLEVVLDGLRSAEGHARVAVHKRVPDAAFPAGGVVGAAWRPAGKGKLRFVFADLAPGDYAVAAFHDADGDGKLGQNAVGMPSRGSGFPTAPRGSWGRRASTRRR